MLHNQMIQGIKYGVTQAFRQASNHLNRHKNSDFKYAAVRGFPKSGTNWLANVLNLHPEIFFDGEFGFRDMTAGREKVENQLKWTVCHAPHMRGTLEEAFDAMVARILLENARVKTSLKGVKWLGDKTPDPAYPPTISNSVCFYMIRDVRDVTVSRAYHLLRVNGTWALEQFPKMQEKVAKHGEDLAYFRHHPQELLDDLDWVRDNAKDWATAVSAAMSQDPAQYPNYRVVTVFYEQMHERLEELRFQWYRTLDLDPQRARPIDFGSQKTSPGLREERPQEFYRKGQIGDWRNYFSDDVLAVVLEEAGETMAQLGYTS